MKIEEHHPTQWVPNDRLASMSDFALAVSQLGVADPQVSRGVTLTTLSPSLLADLDRFENDGSGVEPLEVLAACIRHARPLVMFLDLSGRVLPVRLFPKQGIFACPLDFPGLPEAHLRELRFLRVGAGVSSWVPQPLSADPAAERTGPLLTLMWSVALYGRRFDLLPEIDGRACYRLSPVLAVAKLPVDAAAARVLRRMRRDALALDDIAAEPGIGLERACRMLNGIYLQAGLITLRASPAARQSSWRSLQTRVSK
jgi:hypothetical protein